MKIKHKLLNDFQFLSPDKKIFILKKGVILEEYNYRVKTDIIPIDKDIVDNNPEYFEIIDWKVELLSYMKVNKMPQPAQLGKKLIPFIEEMVLSSIGQKNSDVVIKMDDSKIRELEEKETELFKQEQNIQREKVSIETKTKILKDKEEDISIRLSRVEKRESDIKLELKEIDKKEDLIREKNREIINRELEIEDKVQDINERSRDMDLNMLKSSEEIDSKYKELQSKLDLDIKELTNKEREFELKLKDLSKRESNIENMESDIKNRLDELVDKERQFNDFKNEILKLDEEIKNWEGMHWKFKRSIAPPSAILETRNPNTEY